MGGSLTGPCRGALAVLSACLLYALLLERVRFAHVVRTFRGAEEPWWFGYARDVVTLCCLVSFVAAYRTAGYGDAAALLVGGLALLCEWGIHEALGEQVRVRRALALTLLGSLPVLAPTLLWPNAVGRVVDRLSDALF